MPLPLFLVTVSVLLPSALSTVPSVVTVIHLAVDIHRRGPGEPVRAGGGDRLAGLRPVRAPGRDRFGAAAVLVDDGDVGGGGVEDGIPPALSAPFASVSVVTDRPLALVVVTVSFTQRAVRGCS